ncbi:MAG: indolepyruvate ferredoxin oxidoreductase subunit alpha [Clostridia bacterium]|nr:indolepyruvate ferredoxin oxidoreductase subunit alpha [Clostridia bacterium]
MKELAIGNKAVATGLWLGGCRVVSSYPGTPSTEITEFASQFDMKRMYCEWAPNEKVAMEAAIGASIAGARSFCGMKHVGLNVAADPLFTFSYTGVNAGMVIGVADDPGMHSSQNEQDSRHYAKAAKIMMLEPADSAECLEYTKKAFELSEEFDTPVILRLTTRIAHSSSVIQVGQREHRPFATPENNAEKFVMTPANARKRHTVVEERTRKITAWAEDTPFNKIELNDSNIGVITSGICYQYAKEALGEKASYFKLGCVNPLPVESLKEFASKFEKVYVIEELDPIIEEHCKVNGIDVIGKEAFSMEGEYFQSLIAKVVLNEETQIKKIDKDLPSRPPALCPGCPHRGLFFTLKRLNLFVSGDIGCYTLAAAPPLSMMHTTICMGASISALHGRNKAYAENAKNSVAVIGDSTFAHSGITGLINVVYNQSNSKVIILDNSTTGMTGHQPNPLTGQKIDGEMSTSINVAMLCKAIGIEHVKVVDPNDFQQSYSVIKEEMEYDGPSVIIARSPCVLLKTVKKNPPFTIDRQKCTGCRACMRIGCPAISFKDNKAEIDATQCVGCGQCSQLCKFGAILTGEEK